MKWYIKLGFEVENGNDIENSIKNIAGTHVANMNPNRDTGIYFNYFNFYYVINNTNQYILDIDKEKLGTITGISNFQEWTWPQDPQDEQKNGYIYARALPGIGIWKEYSPDKIEKL